MTTYGCGFKTIQYITKANDTCIKNTWLKYIANPEDCDFMWGPIDSVLIRIFLDFGFAINKECTICLEYLHEPKIFGLYGSETTCEDIQRMEGMFIVHVKEHLLVIDNGLIGDETSHKTPVISYRKVFRRNSK